MSRQNERVDGRDYGLPDGYFLSWVRVWSPVGIEWTVWHEDKSITKIMLPDAYDIMQAGEGWQRDIKVLFEEAVEEHLSAMWEARIEAERRQSLPAPEPLCLPPVALKAPSGE